MNSKSVKALYFFVVIFILASETSIAQWISTNCTVPNQQAADNQQLAPPQIPNRDPIPIDILAGRDLEDALIVVREGRNHANIPGLSTDTRHSQNRQLHHWTLHQCPPNSMLAIIGVRMPATVLPGGMQIPIHRINPTWVIVSGDIVQHLGGPAQPPRRRP